MRTFEYVIKDTIGIHARPAGMLAKEAKKYESKIIIRKGERMAEATRLMAVMSLNVKYGECVEVTVEGVDEEAAYESIIKCFETIL